MRYLDEIGRTKTAPAPTLEERYGVETLCANWNPMVAMSAAASEPRLERPRPAGLSDPGEIDALLERIHLYASQP